MIVEGFDFEKRGRIIVCKRKSIIDLKSFASRGFSSRILSATDLEEGVAHESHEDVNVMAERRIW